MGIVKLSRNTDDYSISISAAHSEETLDGIVAREKPLSVLSRFESAHLPFPTFFLLWSGTRKRVGSAPQASETVFARLRTTLFVDCQKALAPTMSDGNRNAEGVRTDECSPPGPGGLPRCCADRSKKKEWKDMRTQPG
jgi:hypothetical protein